MHLQEPFSIVFEGGEYALLAFRLANGDIKWMLYKETGRKLKRGKRRLPVAEATTKENQE